MAKQLGAIVQIDGADYEVLAKQAENAEKLGGTVASDYAKKTDLFSKNYNDLTNKPTIPTDTNQTVKADGKTFGASDVVEFVAGSNVSISGDTANKKITISATGGGGSSNVNNGTLTIQKNGSNVATFTANSSSDVTANITVPTITDNLISTSTTAALSANQGKVLSDKIDAINTNIGNLGGGDMLKSVYVTNNANNTNKVDKAINAERLGGVVASKYVQSDSTTKITVSQDTPSGGSTGDIWFKY